MSTDRYTLPEPQNHDVHRAAPARGTSAVPAAPTTGAAGEQVSVPELISPVTEESFQRFIELSAIVPLVVFVGAAQDLGSTEVRPLIEDAVARLEGRLLLLIADIQESPGIAQAFQVQSVPTVVAVVGGRPVPLFAGPATAEQIQSVFGQLLELAAGAGVTGRAVVEAAEPEPIPPLHQEAYDALSRGDFPAAAAAFELAVKQQPSDTDAVAGLAQVHLLQRLEGADASSIRSAAANDPTDSAALLAIADLDVSGGHVDDAFDRILTRFADADGDERHVLRERLLELFQVVGVGDPRVSAARSRLTNLLF